MSGETTVSSPAASPYCVPETYDAMYSWLTADIEFYVERAKDAGGPVLEAACGTGRILIPTAEARVDIDGFDREPAMVEALRRKAAARGLAPHVAVADLRDFTMPRRYRLVTVPFRSFLHLMTTGDQIRALRCIRDHLEPEGRVLLNVFYPSFKYMAEHDGRRTHQREFPHPTTGRPVALFDTPRYDRMNQIVTVEREVVEIGLPGEPDRVQRMGFTLRWIYRFEMELLFEAAGFARWEVAGGYDGRPLEKEADEMVWTAWRHR